MQREEERENIYLQCILKDILLETDGGTPFDAMQRYEPISLRDIFANFKTSPRKEETVRRIEIGKRKKCL